MFSSHYWEATEWNVDLIRWAVWGLNCVSLGRMLLTVDQPKLIFNKPLQGHNGDGLLLQRGGLMCFTPRSTKWMAGLLICLHLSWTILHLLSIFVCYSFHCDCEPCTSTLDLTRRYADRKYLLYLLSTQILSPMTLSAVIISKVSSSYGFKCACVVDVPQLRKSSSWVKQGLIVNLSILAY